VAHPGGRVAALHDHLRRVREGGGDARQLERWEGAWINLLRQYELMCDRLGRHLTAGQSDSTRHSSET